MTAHDLKPIKLVRWGTVIAALAFYACSFDMGSHPKACERTAECGDGSRCFEGFCVLEGGSVNPAGGTSGGTAGTSPTAGAGAGGAGSGGTGGNGGNGGNGGDPLSDSGSAGVAGGEPGDAEVVDGSAGSDAAVDPVVAPYAACTSVDDCNADEVCRMISGQGVCSPPCVSKSDCPVPSGAYEAFIECGADGHCRLDCAPIRRPPFPLSCPLGMTCIAEAFGLLTCYTD